MSVDPWVLFNALQSVKDPLAPFESSDRAGSFAARCIKEADLQASSMPSFAQADESQRWHLAIVGEALKNCRASIANPKAAVHEFFEICVEGGRARVSEAELMNWIESHDSMSAGDAGGIAAREFVQNLLADYASKGWLRPLATWDPFTGR